MSICFVEIAAWRSEISSSLRSCPMAMVPATVSNSYPMNLRHVDGPVVLAALQVKPSQRSTLMAVSMLHWHSMIVDPETSASSTY